MGTPEFAVPSLKKLIASAHDVVGVVTQPDRPKGRGLRLSESPIKEAANRHSIPVLQPEDLKSSAFLRKLKDWAADCFVVVGFRILPPEVFEMPPEGTVNLHASLLPHYRGAAPIQWAIIQGENETGVTTFFIEKKVDTGEIILQKAVSIGEEETAGELHDRLASVGADLLLETVDLIGSGNVTCIPQTGAPTAAPKIRPDHCEIDWSRPAKDIVNLVRGLSPRPGAYSTLGGRRLKIFRASVHVLRAGEDRFPGMVVETGPYGIVIRAGTGLVIIQDLQFEGKRRMSAAEFLKGSRLEIGAVFGE